MIQAPECILDVTLPSTSVNLLIAQPFLEFQQPIQEPFALDPNYVDRFSNAIREVFSISHSHGSHFIVLPEFAIPGVKGAQVVRDSLTSAGSRYPVVLIGGVSGLKRDEYQRLCEIENVQSLEDVGGPDSVGPTDWVNTSITFVKDDHGVLSIWVQPKISPSWPEARINHQSMFRGKAIRIFRASFDNGVPCRFLSVLCFDWVARHDSTSVPEALLDQLNSHFERGGSQQTVQWVFVLQHNREPNHHTFLNSTNAFFVNTATHPFVNRADTAIITVSTASSRLPSGAGEYGFSSLTFSPRAPFDHSGCWPTFATQSSRLRSSNALGTCKDVVFREMGECIHSAEVRIPNFVSPDPTGRTAALVNAEEYPLCEKCLDPRIPSASVPAVIKWTNDELDRIQNLSGDLFSGTELEDPIRSSQESAIAAYRYVKSQDLAIRIHMACAERLLEQDAQRDPATDIDTAWDTPERHGLRHVVQTLSLIGTVTPLDAVDSTFHARTDDPGVEIVAICGKSHENCANAFKKVSMRTNSPVLFVSRDDQNSTLLPRESESFANPGSSVGVSITDSQTLLTSARNMAHEQFREYISELMNVSDRRII